MVDGQPVNNYISCGNDEPCQPLLCTTPLGTPICLKEQNTGNHHTGCRLCGSIDHHRTLEKRQLGSNFDGRRDRTSIHNLKMDARDLSPEDSSSLFRALMHDRRLPETLPSVSE
jgi:hypothetical protein